MPIVAPTPGSFPGAGVALLILVLVHFALGVKIIRGPNVKDEEAITLEMRADGAKATEERFRVQEAEHRRIRRDDPIEALPELKMLHLALNPLHLIAAQSRAPKVDRLGGTFECCHTEALVDQSPSDAPIPRAELEHAFRAVHRATIELNIPLVSAMERAVESIRIFGHDPCLALQANARLSLRAMQKTNKPETTVGADHFDRQFYETHYYDPRTQVNSTEQARKLARFIFSYLDLLEVEVSSVIDFGCGIGLFKDAVREIDPAIEYEGVEISRYAAETYGWSHGSVVDYRAEHPSDLVFCQGVLQYLNARDADRALRNLARHADSALYLEVLTLEDWEENVNQELTDSRCLLRPANFYRERLDRHFISCGGGLFVKRDEGITLYELERGYPFLS